MGQRCKLVHLVDFAFADGPESIATTLARAGQLADEGGIANLSLMDHYLQMEQLGDRTNRCWRATQLWAISPVRLPR